MDDLVKKYMIAERTIAQNKLFQLGREVNDQLSRIMITLSLRPTAKDFDQAAKNLKITKSQAIKAWNEFTWGE